ncbi:MAG: alanine dehydrogenase [Alphaproteobacteria bacterium]
MLIGVPKEIKNHEYRVGLVPSSVRELTSRGHKVIVETKAGLGIGVSDDEYVKAGAEILKTAQEIFAKAEMIVKVKEPLTPERAMLREGQILFTYLHLAADEQQTKELVDSKAICIAYETVTDRDGRLPLLAPMSEVAGRMSIQVGAHHLEKAQGGSGVLLGGVTGVLPANVVIIGGGVSGTNALRMAIGMGARVSVLDKSISRLTYLDEIYGDRVRTVYSTIDIAEELVADADLVVGAVLIPGAAAPKVVSKDMIKKMRPGSVLVDIAIDQGGCFETSRGTSHQDPVYTEEGVVHYCVTNMPGAVPRTSSFALNNATLPFTLALADKGYKQALKDDVHLLRGLNVCHGKVTYKAVADVFGYDYVHPEDCIA